MPIEHLDLIRWFILLLSFICVVSTSAAMYILWQKLKIHRMKAICGESW